ncbi:phage tail tube protein [butyrate-producing bacterium]|jgi:hypothetical protein|nr:phage tail tube protein [butyrate-producing bacterium]DAY94064.1 MAG TPA: tail tube protein [Caudoviricetes sp.]
MAKAYTANQVINGTFGEVWFDDDYLAEVVSGQAKVSLTYDDVKRARCLMVAKKLIKAEGKGSIKLNHVRSNIVKKTSDTIKSGKTPSFKIIMKLEDPDALGAERIVLYGCKLDELTLMDWENGKITEETLSFTYESYELLDVIIA